MLIYTSGTFIFSKFLMKNWLGEVYFPHLTKSAKWCILQQVNVEVWFLRLLPEMLYLIKKETKRDRNIHPLLTLPDIPMPVEELNRLGSLLCFGVQAATCRRAVPIRGKPSFCVSRMAQEIRDSKARVSTGMKPFLAGTPSMPAARRESIVLVKSSEECPSLWWDSR